MAQSQVPRALDCYCAAHDRRQGSWIECPALASSISGVGGSACLVARRRAVSAHDIPADVVVHAYLRPDGQRLHVLVRVPLAAMRDVQFPLRGPGYLELAKADDFLRQAALTWVRDSLSLYEDGRTHPRAAAAGRDARLAAVGPIVRVVRAPPWRS